MTRNIQLGQKKEGIPEAQKKALRAWHRAQEKRPTHAASREWFERTFNRRLPPSTLSLILSSKYAYLDLGSAAKTQRQQPPQWPILEARLTEWLKRARETGEVATGDAICNKAREIWPQIPEYADLDTPAFSQGWLYKFRQRFEKTLAQGPQNDASPVAPANTRRELQALRTFAGEFAEENIYNMDETGLMWRKAPFDSLISLPNEPRKDRARVCLIVCTNATGADRIPLWAIGHKAMPEALRTANLKAMECEWRHNRKAWVDIHIMSQWLLMFYQHVGSERRVLLLLDDKPTHTAAMEATPPPSNVHVQYFPMNSSSLNGRQPLRLGITQHLKHHYRKQFLSYMLATFKLGQRPLETIGMYHTLSWITRVWRHDVPHATIYRGFRKCSLIEPQTDYLRAVRLPDMTQLYEKVIAYNQSGHSIQQLEEWLNPGEEEITDEMDENLWRDPSIDTSVLDESINPLPPQELIPSPEDALAGLRTAIRWMLNQPATTVDQIKSLEAVEKVMERKIQMDAHQEQQYPFNGNTTQESAQTAVQASASQPQVESYSQPVTRTQSQSWNHPIDLAITDPPTQSWHPPTRPASQAPPLPPGQQRLPSSGLHTNQAIHPNHPPQRFPASRYSYPHSTYASKAVAPPPALGPNMPHATRTMIRPSAQGPIHIQSATSSEASTPFETRETLGDQRRGQSEEGSYQPSDDEVSDAEMT